MKRLLTFLILFLVATTTTRAQWLDHPDPVFANSSLFSVQVVDKSNIWAIDFGNNIVVKTTNGGITWTALPVTDPTFPNSSLESLTVIDPNTAWVTAIAQPASVHYSRIYKTTDGGATWQIQTTLTNNWTTANHFFDVNNGLHLGLTQLSNTVAPVIAITSNGGATWAPVPLTNLPAGSFPISRRTFSVVNNTLWYMSWDAWIYKSVDKGQTWTATNPGFPTAPSNAPKAIAFINANNGLAASAGVLKRTTDGGATWVTVNPVGTWKSDEIVAVPGTASTYISAGRTTGYAGSYVSFDNGDTWQVLEATNRYFDLHFKDPSTGWAGGLGKMYKFDSNILSGPKPIALISNNFTVSPNPTTGIFTVSGNPLQSFMVEVYNLTGLKVKQQQIQPFRSGKIDLSNQPKGMYLLKIISKGQNITKKVVVQ